MYIKKLSKNEFLDIKKFIVDDKIIENMLSVNTEYDYHIYGKFSNNISAIGCSANSIDMPAWILIRELTFADKDSLAQIVRHICEIKERLGYLQFFTLLTLQEFSYLQEQLKRYQPYLEHAVPAGQATNYESVNFDILRCNTHDQDLLIHLWVLKNEFRID